MANTTPYYRNYDDILQGLLTSFSNLVPSPDTSVGSPVYVFCAVLAHALWSQYKYQDYNALQPFPDTADTNNLNHWGADLGINRQPGQNDTDYSLAILSALKSPPAGGTIVDYQNWALQTPATPGYFNENFLPGQVNVGSGTLTGMTQNWNQGPAPILVKFASTGTLPAPLNTSTTYSIYQFVGDPTQAWIWDAGGFSNIPLTTQGTGLHTIVPQSATLYYAAYVKVQSPPAVPAGQVTVIIKPNDESILGSGAMDNLTNAVYQYIEARRPITAAITNILAAQPLVQNVTVQVSPITADVVTMQNDIAAFMANMNPGDPLYISKLEAICITDGASNANVQIPTGDVTPLIYQVIEPGTITVIPY